MNSSDYLIHELADLAGVSIRTIRYYINEGLLPAPDARGRYSTYREEYLDRLRLIRKLKDAFL
ncbi:MAG TPA: MerR family transcriptional regulator, partial [Anaerolineaceae bacterium]|nr:MerR family transcriptional regulator [Anaerolineaceae bacterium]